MVEWDVLSSLKIEEEKVRDVAMSHNGRRIFILTEKGEVLIYTPDGKIRERIDVGNSIDGISVGPRDDILLLIDRKGSTVKIISLDFIQNINIAGSPFKGKLEAPVVITVFDDFE
jgi:hypothetical protein